MAEQNNPNTFKACRVPQEKNLHTQDLAFCTEIGNEKRMAVAMHICVCIASTEDTYNFQIISIDFLALHNSSDFNAFVRAGHKSRWAVPRPRISDIIDTLALIQPNQGHNAVRVRKLSSSTFLPEKTMDSISPLFNNDSTYNTSENGGG